jgi:hypothetical protein
MTFVLADPPFSIVRPSALGPRPARRNPLLRFTIGDQLDPRLDVEVILIDIPFRVEREEVVLRRANLDEFRHVRSPPLSSGARGQLRDT